MENIQFISADILTSVAGQILAVTVLVAITRKLLGDKVKTIYYATAWALAITLLVAFWSDLPPNLQTAIVAVLNGIIIVLGAYGGNKAAVWLKDIRTPELTAQHRGDTGPQKQFVSEWV